MSKRQRSSVGMAKDSGCSGVGSPNPWDDHACQGPPTPDPRDGCGERHLGRGTHCQRTEAEARNPGLTPHRGELSARRRSGAHAQSQAALADLHNHAKFIVACDFFVVVTASFRNLYVFVLMEVGSRRLLHHSVTAPPPAEWTFQQS